MPSIEQSRRILLDEIGPAPDLTFVRPYGNIGDQLIWAGTRELLSGHLYREIDVDALSSAAGELAVIAGGAAWCKHFIEYLPEVLAVAELRFERVIVLPSSFEVSEDRTRAALERTRATVFARELESFARIQPFCRARLAHDGAFFADYSDYAAPGEGELNAFRADPERLGDGPLPESNDDISETAGSLEQWLRTIERYAVINTDRMHVMIAGALMGKRINYAPTNYFKLESMVRSCMAGHDVHPLLEDASGADAGAPQGGSSVTVAGGADATEARVTVAALVRDHPEDADAAARAAATATAKARVSVHDRNSRAGHRARSATGVDFELKSGDRDPGLASAMRLAAEQAQTDYIVFLGDGARLAEGALDALVDALDADPQALAVAPAVLDGTGTTLHCGGHPRIEGRSLTIDHCDADGSAVAGPAGWVPPQGTLFRVAALRSDPLENAVDPAHDPQLLIDQWCLNARATGAGRLLRLPSARMTLDRTDPPVGGDDFVQRARSVRELPGHANFFERTGLLHARRLGELVPELLRDGGGIDEAAAALLLAHVTARGPEHTLMEWMNGGLEPLFDAPSAKVRAIDPDRIDWLEQRNQMLTGIENGTWWRLRGRLAPFRRVARALRRTPKAGGT